MYTRSATRITTPLARDSLLLFIFATDKRSYTRRGRTGLMCLPRAVASSHRTDIETIDHRVFLYFCATTPRAAARRGDRRAYAASRVASLGLPYATKATLRLDTECNLNSLLLWCLGKVMAKVEAEVNVATFPVGWAGEDLKSFVELN
jgi:hypothetical protein